MTHQEVKHYVNDFGSSLVYNKIIAPIVRDVTYAIWVKTKAGVIIEIPHTQVYVAIHNEERNTNKPNSGGTK